MAAGGAAVGAPAPPALTASRPKSVRKWVLSGPNSVCLNNNVRRSG